MILLETAVILRDTEVDTERTVVILKSPAVILFKDTEVNTNRL